MIVGLPIIRKLLVGEDVELESLGVTLIPDDVLWNARPRPEAGRQSVLTQLEAGKERPKGVGRG